MEIPFVGSKVWLRLGGNNFTASISTVGEVFKFRLEDGVEVSSTDVEAWCYVPGSVVGFDKERIYVATGDGFVAVEELQPSGKKRMSSADFMRGNPVKAGDMFGGV